MKKLELMARIMLDDAKNNGDAKNKVIEFIMDALKSDKSEYKRYEDRYNIREEIKTLPFYTVYDNKKMEIIKTFKCCNMEMCNLLKENKNYSYLNASIKSHREIFYQLKDSQKYVKK